VTAADVTVESSGRVAVVEIHRPPNNFFDAALIKAIADAYERLDDDVECSAIVLCAEGKHFCTGADFSVPAVDRVSPNELYAQAIRLFRTGKPVVHRGARGRDRRRTRPCPQCRLPGRRILLEISANFSRLGLHPGFGITVTLPHAVGQQKALEWMPPRTIPFRSGCSGPTSGPLGTLAWRSDLGVSCVD
jgi:enoyl-CoA hydratase/carnithine racemase